MARDGWNLLASDDEWTAPIAAEVGPDGALWVIDWYNFIVQHNPTPSGFKTGKGGAYETPATRQGPTRPDLPYRLDRGEEAGPDRLDRGDISGLRR